MYNVFVAKQSIEIGYSNVGYIRKGSISVIQVKEMLVMARFTLPRDLYFGENALETLKTIKGNKAVLCLGGGSMKRFGFVDKVVEYLKEAGIETKTDRRNRTRSIRRDSYERCQSDAGI